MHILHGTWIPKQTDEFLQRGAFHLWIETKTPKKTDPLVNYLAPKELAVILVDKLGIGPNVNAVRHRSEICHVLVPSHQGHPLPSPELARWLAMALPEDQDIKLAYQQIASFPLTNPVKDLSQLYFLAAHQLESLQLGADLLFWIHISQHLKEMLLKDQYIPALKYRALPSKGKVSNRFEIHPGWEIVSPNYEANLQRALETMPSACASAFEQANGDAVLWDKGNLLRHFSQCVLTNLVTRPLFPAAFTKKIRGSLLEECIRPHDPETVWGNNWALERYQQWQIWEKSLTTQYHKGFRLCFQLLEADSEQTPWRIKFFATAWQDPSLKLDLADYWHLNSKTKRPLLQSFGEDFEQQLLTNLAHAARMYPKLWQGMETERPVGLELSLDEAFTFLKEYAWVLQDAGFQVIVPAWWTPQGRQRARLRLRASGGNNTTKNAVGTSYFSLDALVNYRYELSIGDQPVTQEEWQALVEAKTPLVQFRGQWIELEQDKMEQMLDFWQTHGDGEDTMNLADVMWKMASDEHGVDVSHAPLLSEMLAKLQQPSHFQPVPDPPEISGNLRDYQKRGVAWVQYLESLGLNGCLADDMGLGKTLQVIARLATTQQTAQHPTLLVVPTSVLGNWEKEIEKFAPQLKVLVHHGPDRTQESTAFQALVKNHDVIITSYTLARKDAKLLEKTDWQRVVIDEAQNIKNPKTAQTKAILKLRSSHRLALTGTPVENRLLDLWSIFNFLNPGYLGTQARFRKEFELPIQKDNRLSQAELLKKLVQPFILRRVKTDQSIIKDLPDKVEHKQYCNLTKEQASLYQAVVQDVEEALQAAEGMQRKGLILSTLMKLKQICNHPRQFLQDNSAFTPERSHKLARLLAMLEEVIAEGESLLIFTQFTEIGAALQTYLAHALGCSTYYLHGGTRRTQRERMIREFQDSDSQPAAFILSLKAGGVGITLTKANHVFHFDRWWNPAVEDQATDRAFRIGQNRNVFVHKFVTLGSLEERIDQMIEDKKKVAGSIVGSDESWLTELDNQSFKQLIALNRQAVID
jgi:SNF2 family DNA or RNA helicase